nr:DUF551 domain-containing protein [Klebsiella variicola]
MLLNVCGAAFELADDSCQQDVDGEDCHVVPDDAFQKLSDALDEIENTLPTEDIDRPDVFLTWSAVPRAALKSLLQAGNSPAQSDCCPAQNVVAPAQSPIDHGYRPECECSGCKATARTCTEMAVNSLVIPDEMTSEQAYEIGYCYGDPVDVFARGANWMRQHIIDSTLAAAPQLPGSDPATVPGKWIPVSERMPEDDDFVYIWPRPDFGVELHVGQYCEFSPKGDGWYAQVHEQNYGIEWHPITVTHWMPLPAAPQEVRGE